MIKNISEYLEFFTNAKIICLLAISLLFYVPVVPAANVSLAWDPPTNNIDGTLLTDLGGYKLYWGTSSRVYTNVQDTGLVLTYSLVGLPSGTTNYFAVTAYTTITNESTFSDELAWYVPAFPGLTTVKSVSYTPSTSKASVVFNLAQLDENGKALSNAVALLVRYYNVNTTNQTSVAVASHPATTATVSLTIPPNSGMWSICGAISNSFGQVAPWGDIGYTGTTSPTKPGKPKIVSFQY